MSSAFTNPPAAQMEARREFSGTGAVLLADLRDVAKLSEQLSPGALVERLNRITTALISAVERNGGIVHLQVGGSLVAYWPPSRMPAAAGEAIEVASDAVAAGGGAMAVSVAIADLALAAVGPATAKRPWLAGAAYPRAEATLRHSRAGVVTVDFQTLAALPPDIQARFARNDRHAELP